MLAILSNTASYTAPLTSARSTVTRSSAVSMESVEDLKALAVKCNPTIGYYNPLALGETTRENAVRRVAAGTPRVGAIKVEDGVGLVAEVGELGDARLHAEGHLVLTDPRRDLGISGGLVAHRVEFGESVEHAATPFPW